MYRTYDRTQKFENEYDKLIGLGPIARVNITATPVPVLLALNEEKEADEMTASILNLFHLEMITLEWETW
jgi:hypothetical protein